MEDFAVALVFVTLFASTAAVLILRPLTKRLGEYLKQMQKQRDAERVEQRELERIHALLERVSGRLELVEERLDFTERMLSPGQRSGQPSGTGSTRLRPPG